ncbi:MAG: hypothetical protein KME46_02840 [Brasilonema angustatum HA4187-MV1]|nr:hypothetical protein [Brasilonema angustatum HA4187-MV1]
MVWLCINWCADFGTSWLEFTKEMGLETIYEIPTCSDYGSLAAAQLCRPGRVGRRSDHRSVWAKVPNGHDPAGRSARHRAILK